MGAFYVIQTIKVLRKIFALGPSCLLYGNLGAQLVRCGLGSSIELTISCPEIRLIYGHCLEI